MSIERTVTIEGQQFNIVKHEGNRGYHVTDTFGSGISAINSIAPDDEGFFSAEQAVSALEDWMGAEVAI